MANPTVLAMKLPSGSVSCRYEGHKCTRERVANERFCLRHMGVQRDSTIKQCNYVSAKSSIRCPNRLERNDCNKDGLCLPHARMISSVKRSVGKKQRRRNADYLKWQSIAAYSAVPTPKINLNDKSAEYHSESSDSEDFSSPLPSGNQHEEVSDEEFDGPDDPLRRAGVYSTDEITMMTRDKMLKLQCLYVEEMSKLKELYLKRKCYYAPLIKAEEAMMTDAKPQELSADNKDLRRLEAMQNYMRITGVEKLMRKRWARLKDFSSKVKTTCKEPECHLQPLVSSRYCLSHILYESSQRLFKKCGQADCAEAVLRFSAENKCDRHNHDDS